MTELLFSQSIRSHQQSSETYQITKNIGCAVLFHSITTVALVVLHKIEEILLFSPPRRAA
jgi:hypothetical protein